MLIQLIPLVFCIAYQAILVQLIRVILQLALQTAIPYRMLSVFYVYQLLLMQEENRSVKELIKNVLQKCKDALPELILLTKHFERLSQNQKPKVKKKDCLNPTFLIRLSQCGQNIRRILTQALSRQFPGKQILKRQYNDYMQVIYDIRKYHEEAHLAHDMHQYSTAQKKRLLDELKDETLRRMQVQAELTERETEVKEKDEQIREMEERIREIEEKVPERDDPISISQISKISKKGVLQGQFYGGKAKVGTIETDYELSVETARLRKRIIELQSQLEERDQSHRQEIENQKMQVLELQRQLEDLMRSVNSEGGKQEAESCQKLQGFSQFDETARLLLIQAKSIDQYINEQQYDQ